MSHLGITPLIFVDFEAFFRREKGHVLSPKMTFFFCLLTLDLIAQILTQFYKKKNVLES